MAYSELVKNFNRVRDYMREFYVYGFKSREEYTAKSARSYDDERRRVESWLGDWMRFRRTPDGKNVFLSIDSRVSRRNPLYTAWKTKSFTDGDITLHFILLDILHSPGEAFTLAEITEQIDGYLQGFAEPRLFDESTVRKKLKEYADEGIVETEKHGRTMYYRCSAGEASFDADALDFFSEVSPCGVVGSFLQDRAGQREGSFTFKHHYITGALDSEVLCALFDAMGQKRFVTLETYNRQKGRGAGSEVVPLRVMVSVQNGRQYLMAYSPLFHRVTPYRTDHIVSVKAGGVCPEFDEMRGKLDRMMPHLWGVSAQSVSGQRMEHVEFTVRYADDEGHIHSRLEREKRCGTVERLDRNHSRFSADVYDAQELVPWIRTFLCRITDLHFSDPALEERFKNDLRGMYALYGLEGGDAE